MNCPKCSAQDAIRYSVEIPYEIVYKLKKDGTPYKRGTKRQCGDARFDCYYCTECRKEFNFDTVDGKVVLEYTA